MNDSNRPAQTHELLERLLNDGIKANCDPIARIVAPGGIAVLLFEPDALGQRVARVLGWNGRSAVFELRRTKFYALASSDRTTAAWLARDASDVGRIFVIVHRGTLLVNHAPGRGFWIEPGSTDAERTSARA